MSDSEIIRKMLEDLKKHWHYGMEVDPVLSVDRIEEYANKLDSERLSPN